MNRCQHCGRPFVQSGAPVGALCDRCREVLLARVEAVPSTTLAEVIAAQAEGAQAYREGRDGARQEARQPASRQSEDKAFVSRCVPDRGPWFEAPLWWLLAVVLWIPALLLWALCCAVEGLLRLVARIRERWDRRGFEVTPRMALMAVLAAAGWATVALAAWSHR